MRTITVITGARSDYGILLPVLRKLKQAPDICLRLIAAGMHLVPEFGNTVKQIEDDGFVVEDKIDMLLASDTPEAIAKSMGLGTIGFAQAFARRSTDLLVTLGDRTETHAAVVAALPFKIAVAHIHGGEISEGAIDDCLRHSITKMSHLHFVATEAYGRRVCQMGEEPWRVTVSGAPALDNIREIPLLSIRELEARFSVRLPKPPLIVTYHPVTLEHEDAEWQTGELLAALDQVDMPIIITKSNSDTGGRLIAQMMKAFTETHPNCSLVDNLGTQGYFSLMAQAGAMVGNSSSGLIEAPSFQLPVVNIGNRQRGRSRAANVIDVGYSRDEILAGIRRALEPMFRSGLRDLVNPFGNGQAAEIIVDTLRRVPIDDRLICKRFCDVPTANPRLGFSARTNGSTVAHAPEPGNQVV